MKFQVKELLSRIGTQEEKGQTLIEYGLIILFISIVVIIVLGVIGVDIQNAYTSIINSFWRTQNIFGVFCLEKDKKSISLLNRKIRF